MPKFLLLNGPPHSGKDMLAKELISYITFSHMKFSAPLKRMACALLNCDHRWLEANKDKPCKMLFRGDWNAPESERWATPRQLQIWLSEVLLKPMFGEEVLANILWQEAMTNNVKFAIVTDSGFPTEAQRIVTNAGRGSVVAIRLHREGCNYDGDSRGYLPNGICQTYDLHNDQTKHQITMFALMLIQKHFDVTLLKEPTWVR